MKVYPFLFLLLFLGNRRYKEIALSFLSAGLLTLASLAYITPSISYSWHGIGRGLKDYQEDVFMRIIAYAIPYDHSIFTVAKRLYASIAPSLPHMRIAVDAYLVTLALVGAVLCFGRMRHLPIVNQVLCLTLIQTFWPPSSFDYTLINLFIPFTLLTYSALEAPRQEHLATMMLLLGSLMAGMTELIYRRAGFGGQARACLSLVLLYFAVRFPIELTVGPHRPADLLAPV